MSEIDRIISSVVPKREMDEVTVAEATTSKNEGNRRNFVGEQEFGPTTPGWPIAI